MVMKKLIAVIPARGGSKRIPMKNIVDFCGKPLIAWTIDAAQKSKLFDKIIVSTDSEEIAEVSRKFGADVPFLRDKAFDDYATVSEATIATLEQIQNSSKDEYDVVVQLMSTCPIRNEHNILDAYTNFVNRSATSQISCFEYGYMNPWWAVQLDNDLNPTKLFADTLLQRKQDSPKLYCPSGAIWISQIKTLCDTGTFYSKKHIFYPMNWKTAIDIDTFDDLDMAKAIYSIVQSK